MKTRLVIFALMILGTAFHVSAQSDANAAVVSELRTFYDAYGEDLRQGRREGIADRYDRRGTYFLGNGSKALATFEQTKRSYLTRWSAPKAFAWKDLEFEVITPTAVNVIGRFEWATEKDPNTKTCSYTGLVLKTGGQWRIRIEDESCPTK